MQRARGRDADPAVQEPRGPGRAVPVVAADAPLRQPLGWDAEDWATQGGRVKTDWSHAPFTAHYRNSTASSPSTTTAGFGQEMDATAQQAMKWARENYMVYDYCADAKRFPQGFPPECSMA
jgi:xyloglucan:xyloglucosyl transferase TCH4